MVMMVEMIVLKCYECCCLLFVMFVMMMLSLWDEWRLGRSGSVVLWCERCKIQWGAWWESFVGSLWKNDGNGVLFCCCGWRWLAIVWTRCFVVCAFLLFLDNRWNALDCNRSYFGSESGRCVHFVLIEGGKRIAPSPLFWKIKQKPKTATIPSQQQQ